MLSKLKNITKATMTEEAIDKIELINIKGESVLELKRFDNNTWILENGKTTEIVKVNLIEKSNEQ